MPVAGHNRPLCLTPSASLRVSRAGKQTAVSRSRSGERKQRKRGYPPQGRGIAPSASLRDASPLMRGDTMGLARFARGSAGKDR